MRIDREDGKPVYKQISEALRLKILAGEYAPGERLPSLRELAAQLNVSLLTVQQAMNDLVHQELIVRQHGKGNFIRSAPPSDNRRRLIGMIGGQVSNPYNASLMERCREMLERHSFDFLPVLSLKTRDDAARAIRFLLDEGISGAFVLPIESFWEEQLLWDFRRERVPFVYLDSRLDLYSSDYVVNDYLSGMAAALDFLHSLNHKRIACITAQPYTAATRRKLSLFSMWMKEKGNELPAHWTQVGSAEHQDGGYLATKALLATNDLPTALVATNDLVAQGAYRALGEAGLQIPDDMSVIGSGDFNNCLYYSPPLTTLRIDVERMCQIAVDVMMRRLKETSVEEFEQITIQPTLVVRASTAELASRRRSQTGVRKATTG